MNFNIPIRQIANPAADAQSYRNPARKIAISDTLHTAANSIVPGQDHLKFLIGDLKHAVQRDTRITRNLRRNRNLIHDAIFREIL